MQNGMTFNIMISRSKANKKIKVNDLTKDYMFPGEIFVKKRLFERSEFALFRK